MPPLTKSLTVSFARARLKIDARRQKSSTGLGAKEKKTMRERKALAVGYCTANCNLSVRRIGGVQSTRQRCLVALHHEVASTAKRQRVYLSAFLAAVICCSMGFSPLHPSIHHPSIIIHPSIHPSHRFGANPSAARAIGAVWGSIHQIRPTSAMAVCLRPIWAVVRVAGITRGEDRAQVTAVCLYDHAVERRPGHASLHPLQSPPHCRSIWALLRWPRVDGDHAHERFVPIDRDA